MYNVSAAFQTPGEITIIVDEANDNKPTFLESSYDEVFPEVSCSSHWFTIFKIVEVHKIILSVQLYLFPTICNVSEYCCRCVSVHGSGHRQRY